MSPNKYKEGQPTQGTEALWNVKAGSDGKRKNTYSYKDHMNVDEEGLIKSTDYQQGNVHDSNYFTERLDSDESAVYTDSTYASEKHDK